MGTDGAISVAEDPDVVPNVLAEAKSLWMQRDPASQERATALLRPFIHAEFITDNGFWNEPWEWLDRHVFDNGSLMGELRMHTDPFVISFDEDRKCPYFGGRAIFCLDFFNGNQHLEETPEEGSMPFDVLSAFTSSLNFCLLHPDIDGDGFDPFYVGEIYHMQFVEPEDVKRFIDGVATHQFPSMYDNSE